LAASSYLNAHSNVVRYCVHFSDAVFRYGRHVEGQGEFQLGAVRNWTDALRDVGTVSVPIVLDIDVSKDTTHRESKELKEKGYIRLEQKWCAPFRVNLKSCWTNFLL
jgi:hypothetical protein